MLHPQSNDHPALSLPWEMILGFCTFDEILTVRSVSRGLHAVIANAISSEFCLNFLKRYMKWKNMYYIPHLEEWKTAATQDSVESIFSMDSSLYLDTLLQVLRVIKYLPVSMAVAFDAKHGRHCLPLQWNPSKQSSEFMTFSSSGRNSLQFKTEPRLRPLNHSTNTTSTSNASNNNIYGHLELHNERGQPLDLQTYLNASAPNMPENLICPICKNRTLVLSEFSYVCEPGSEDERPSHVQLSWTPRKDGNDSCNNEAGTTEEKRQVKEGCLHSFPPMEDDMAIPTRSRPLSLKRDCKFTISIHCTCRQFGVLSPAGVCWNQSFCCAERGRAIGDKTIGGVLVRQKCSSNDCNRPVSCPQCTHNRTHEGYMDESGESLPVIRGSHCDVCKLTFCDEDAWLSSISHHW
ncbi:unnamed protein product [Cylindrotheca closterium]|uniref:Uncharacterized protein n=1 Tax=Cylindrotheca closterium TaxID=2856 RepID=A0AAD2GDG7_9STRA|nr:unnamed protein product [Cylindrotheca closterium]